MATASVTKKTYNDGKTRALIKGKSDMELSPEQFDILVATALGDSSIEKTDPKHNARVSFQQTFPNHAAYLSHLYLKLQNLTGSKPKVQIRKPDPRTEKIYSSFVFKTLRFPVINKIYDLFYVNGVKRVPLNIVELLNPRVLAYWIMDDGGTQTSGTLQIHTNSFTEEEVGILVEALVSKFGIAARKTLKRPGQ